MKSKSEAIIERLGLQPNKNLPEIEKIEELNFRNGSTIARRILVLGYLYAISFDVKRKVIKANLNKHGLISDLSKNEQKILSKFFLTKQDKINIDWVTENIEVLGWAIGLWNDIPILKKSNEERQADNIPIHQDPSDFINNAELISKEQIYSQADLIYRLHWIAKRDSIGELGKNSNDVYMERHKAINWIIDNEINWDNVPTDT
jgi:hypothetical protein